MKPYTHRCVVRDGPAAGNKAAVDVTWFDSDYIPTCEFCGEPEATVEQIVAHIYNELVDLYKVVTE